MIRVFRNRWFTVFPAIVLAGVLLRYLTAIVGQFYPQELSKPFHAGDWFQLRDTLSRFPNAPAFYRGMNEYGFHDWDRADRDLASVSADSWPETIHAQIAARSRKKIWRWMGYNRTALTLTSQQRLTRSLLDAEDLALGSYPDQSIEHRQYVRVPYASRRNRTMIDIAINEIATRCEIDTGSDFSSVGETEARRLRLDVKPLSFSVSGFGMERQVIGVAVADRLAVREFVFRHVALLIEPDELEEKVTIGLPVIVGLGGIRWNSDGALEFGFDSIATNPGRVNLCFYHSLVTPVAVGGRNLLFEVDTGSAHTVLYPEALPSGFGEILEEHQSWTFGHGSTVNKAQDARVLPELNLELGGLSSKLGPAYLLSRKPIDRGASIEGTLGMDFLGRARSASLDFNTMKFTFDCAEPACREPQRRDECILPPGFSCQTGWTCSVNSEPGLLCYIDRNRGKESEPAPAQRCRIPQGFICGNTCKIHFPDTPGECRIEQTRSSTIQAR